MGQVESIEEMTYESARDELVSVVTQLEQGGATLEESLVLWERGEALASRCEEWLLGARKRLDQARAANTSAAVGNSAESSSADSNAADGGAF